MKAEYKAETMGFGEALGRAAKALLVAIAFTVVVFLVMALLMTATSIPEKAIPAVVLVTMTVSVIIAGFLAARQTGSRGFLRGAGLGVFYVLLLYVVASLVTGDFGISTYLLTLLAIGVFAGAFGGILGVNAGSKKR